MTKDKEGVATILNETGELVFIIRRDPKTSKNVVYKAVEASVDEITDVMVPFIGIGK